MVGGARYSARIPGARSTSEAQVAEGVARHKLYQRQYGAPTGDEVFVDYATSVASPWSRYHMKVFREYFGQKRPKNSIECRSNALRRIDSELPRALVDSGHPPVSIASRRLSQEFSGLP